MSALRDRRTLTRQITGICDEIAGSLRLEDPSGPVTMWRCPEPNEISVGALRRLHRALMEFVSEATLDEMRALS